MRIMKTFKQIRDRPNAEKYEGKSSRVLYSLWKDAVEREVMDLELDSSQWLDLLKARTKGEAHQVVQEAAYLSLETSPEKALEHAWKYLDNEFQTTRKPSQWIYSNIIAGSTISLTDLDGLRTFARSCESAKGLMESSPKTFLSFNEQMTQELSLIHI